MNLVEGTQGACETRPSKVFRWSKNRLRRQFPTNPRRSMTKQGPYWKVGGGKVSQTKLDEGPRRHFLGAVSLGLPLTNRFTARFKVQGLGTC